MTSTIYKMATLRQWTQKGFHNAPKVVECKVAIIGGAKNGEGKLAFEYVRVTESPLTANLSDDDLYHIFDSPLKCDYPCHSQSVEHVLLYSKLSIYRTLAVYLPTFHFPEKHGIETFHSATQLLQKTMFYSLQRQKIYL